jgi:glycerol-1-phosphatase
MVASGTPARGAVSFPVALVDRYGHVLLDIDGVVRRGSEPIPGAGAAVAAIEARGIDVTYVTNNSSATPADLAAKLRAVDVAAAPEQILTSAAVAASLLEPATRCLVIGMEGLREALDARGCVVVTDPAQAEAVVVGFDNRLTWAALRDATLALHAGARFLATNDDPTFPSPEGLWPGNGAIVAALERSSGRRAEIAGKPHAPLLLAAAARCDRSPVLFVGDRHSTDIAGGAALGWDTALVLTGVTPAEAVPGLEPAPTYVLDSVAGMLRPAPAS